MKKKLLLVVCSLMLFLAGCGKYDEKDVLKDFSKMIEKTNGYHLEGNMEIINNEDIYTYKVNVAYKKDNMYKVSLVNKSNNHEQIILKNNEGVYVLTPSLNKSFKFQSDWPNNNSQIYIPQAILKDIKQDENKTFEEKDGYYLFKTKVDYPNNRRLDNQVVYLDENLNLVEVQVFDLDGNIAMKMKFDSVDMKATFDDEYFTLNENMQSNPSSNLNKTEETLKIEDIIYPMYIPDNTHLKSQDKVAKEDGERIILTFEGENPFMLVEETVKKEEELVIVPTYGEPELLIDTVGSITDNSVNWISNGVEYYVVSNNLSKDELINVAKSISVLPVGAMEK